MKHLQASGRLKKNLAAQQDQDLDIMLQAKLFHKTTFSGLFICSSSMCAFLVNAMCE